MFLGDGLAGFGGQGGVRQEMTNRVRAVAAQMGYHAARAKGQGARLIGVLLPDLSDPCAALMLAALQARCEAADYTVLAVQTLNRPTAERRALAALLAARPQALALALSAKTCEQLAFAALPSVVMIGGITPPPLCSSVGIDEEGAGHALTQHLIALGHRRILFASSEQAPAARLRGYQRALQAAGLAARNLAGLRVDARQGHCHLLRAHSPTAIIADHEPLAYALLGDLVANGVQVPQQISLASFGSSAALPPLRRRWI